jgi:catechol 2,3-dioxygenase-like lactoylglutathione lyase family enzyme
MNVTLDHVNIRTAHVEELAAFYAAVLDLARGPRPAFPFAGAWLYSDGRPIVHLVDAGAQALTAAQPEELRISHFAFRATGLEAFLARLQRLGVSCRVARLPGADITQVNLLDPDGNALHVDFAGPSGPSP